MLRIPLPEDDRFALRLSSLCVSVPSASSGTRLRSRIVLAPRGATEQEIASFPALRARAHIGAKCEGTPKALKKRKRTLSEHGNVPVRRSG